MSVELGPGRFRTRFSSRHLDYESNATEHRRHGLVAAMVGILCVLVTGALVARMRQDILIEHCMCLGITPRAAARRIRGSAAGRDEGLRWKPVRRGTTVPRVAYAFR
jgi:hypothetical protein